MTETERSRYICCVQMINSDGTLGRWLMARRNDQCSHTNARLLAVDTASPVFVPKRALHNYHPDVCVPFMD